MSTNVTPMRIDGAAVEADDHTSVFSPYDGRELGRVPKGTEADVNNAVAVALDRHRGGAPAERKTI